MVNKPTCLILSVDLKEAEKVHECLHTHANSRKKECGLKK